MLLHLLLVKLSPLSSIQWKKVDYIWLSFALLGILAAAANNRSAIAGNLVQLAEARNRGSLEWVYRSADFGTSAAICRSFVRGPASPPQEEFDRIQREFNSQCSWFKSVVASLGPLDKRLQKPIDLQGLVGPPPAAADDWAIKSLVSAVAVYNSSLRDLDILQKEKAPGDGELILQFLGPIVLALALALRLTKVTGEIQLERKRHVREA